MVPPCLPSLFMLARSGSAPQLCIWLQTDSSDDGNQLYKQELLLLVSGMLIVGSCTLGVSSVVMSLSNKVRCASYSVFPFGLFNKMVFFGVQEDMLVFETHPENKNSS